MPADGMFAARSHARISASPASRVTMQNLADFTGTLHPPKLGPGTIQVSMVEVRVGSGPTRLTVSITSPLYPRKRTLEWVKQDQDDPPVCRRRCPQYRRTLSSS